VDRARYFVANDVGIVNNQKLHAHEMVLFNG
jgi:hypothetical protein